MQRDAAQDLVAHQQRSENGRLCRFAIDLRGLTHRSRLARQVSLDEQRLARLHHVPPEADDRARFIRESRSSLDGEGEAHHIRPLVEDGDVHNLRIEHVTRALPDELVHRLRLELRREPTLHVVDDRQLGGTSIRLREQPFRLVEEPHILERDAQAPPDRRQKPDVSIAERILVLEVLDQEDAGHVAARHDRDEEG